MKSTESGDAIVSAKSDEVLAMTTTVEPAAGEEVEALEEKIDPEH